MTNITVDAYGGFVLQFQNGERLHAFVHSTCGEDWRILIPGNLDSHTVVSGGRIED